MGTGGSNSQGFAIQSWSRSNRRSHRRTRWASGASCSRSRASTTLSLACARTAPSSSARWSSTRTSTGSATCEGLPASSFRWPRNSPELGVDRLALLPEGLRHLVSDALGRGRDVTRLVGGSAIAFGMRDAPPMFLAEADRDLATMRSEGGVDDVFPFGRVGRLLLRLHGPRDHGHSDPFASVARLTSP